MERLQIDAISYSMEYLDDFDLNDLNTLDSIEFDTGLFSVENIAEEMDFYDNMESLYSTESIGGAIKRMAYNLASVMKNLFNLVFGFISAIFKSSINTKVVMKKNLEVLKKYRKELGNMLSAGNLPDGDIETKDFAGRSLTSLKLLLAIIQASEEAIARSVKDSDGHPIVACVSLCVSYGSMISAIVVDNGAFTMPDAVKKPNEKYTPDFCERVGKMYNKAKDKTVGAFKKIVDAVIPTKIKGARQKQQDGKKKQSNAGVVNLNESMMSIKSGIEELSKSASGIETITNAYKAELVDKTIAYKAIISYLIKQIDDISTVITNNKFDYSKVVSTLDKMRLAANKAISKMDPQNSVDGSDEGKNKNSNNISVCIELFSAMGTLVSKMTPLVRQLASNVTSDVDKLATEVARVGSKISKSSNE